VNSVSDVSHSNLCLSLIVLDDVNGFRIKLVNKLNALFIYKHKVATKGRREKQVKL
jgi:hypothetical protein